MPRTFKDIQDEIEARVRGDVTRYVRAYCDALGYPGGALAIPPEAVIDLFDAVVADTVDARIADLRRRAAQKDGGEP